MARTLMERLVEAGVPLSDMDHHESDLYVFVTPRTTEVVEAWCEEIGSSRHAAAPVFVDQVTGRLMYDCAFAFDPSWESVGAEAGKEGRHA